MFTKHSRNFIKLLILTVSLVLFTFSLTEASRLRPKAFEGELELSKSPRVGENATLSLSLDSKCSESLKAEIVFWIPEGITTQTQIRFEQAYIHAKSTGNRYSTAISVNKTGNYTFRASVYAELSNGKKIFQYFYSHLLVTSTSSKRSPIPFDSKTLETQNSLNSNIHSSPKLLEQTEVFGEISYFDLNNSKLLPIKGLKIILVRDNSRIRDEELAISYTDESGRFSFPPISKNPNEIVDLYVVASFSNDILYITDRNNDVYEFQSDVARDVQAGELEFELELNRKPELGILFNTVTKAHDFFLEKTGWSRDKIQVIWPVRGNVSYYFVESLGDRITEEKLNIIEEDAWQKISVYHEYGHSVMTSAYGNDIDALPQSFYNGSHTLSTVSDQQFAMSEGWAEFVEGAVEDNALNVTGYINADSPNIETNSWWTGDIDGNGNNQAGENVEGTVASILWDITDTVNSIDLSPNVDDDGISDMFSYLWTIFVEDRPTDIVDIAVGWRNRDFPKLSELEEIYAEHHVLLKTSSPVVLKIMQPSENVVVNRSFTVQWKIEESDDENYNINLLYLYQNKEHSIVSSLPSFRTEYTWNTKSLTEGKYYVVVQLVDAQNEVIQKVSDSNIFIDHSPLMPPEIASSSHPVKSEWYSDSSPRFELNTFPEHNPRRKYSYVFDQNSQTVPDEKYDYIGNTLEVSGLADGKWYLHVRALDELGYWSDVSHFPVKIDSTPPPTVKDVSWELNNSNGNAVLIWDSVDDESGIESYQVQIDVNSNDFSDGLFYDGFVKGSRKTFELPANSTYYARVKAKNGAGLLSSIWSQSSELEIKLMKNIYDVNSDGRVDVFDLVLVAVNFGRIFEESIANNPDVNNDGSVNIFDLVLVAKYLEGTQELTASPIHRIKQPKFETQLYQNYPNPFNLETWIPYILKHNAEVNIKIYAPSGKVVKTISCGYQKAGDYRSRSKAAFWDGRDEYGSEVSSGVYFYVLQAEDNPPLVKKMLVVK